MKHKKKLISESEIKHYARVPRNFPACNLEPDFKLIRELFNCKECLTNELYKRLIEDLIDYSDVEKYSSKEQNYVIGSLAVYNGTVYKALVEKPKEPNCNTDWQAAPKFNKPCFNELWCDEGLAEYISLCIYKERLPETIDSERYKDEKEYYSMVYTRISKRMKKAFDCACKFIIECDDPSCFQGVGGNNRLSCGCMSTCSCSEINTLSWGIY